MSGQDRLAIAIIEDAEQKGELKSDLQKKCFFSRKKVPVKFWFLMVQYIYIYTYTQINTYDYILQYLMDRLDEI